MQHVKYGVLLKIITYGKQGMEEELGREKRFSSAIVLRKASANSMESSGTWVAFQGCPKLGHNIQAFITLY